jgi:pilus assembly protein Flp/PilA
MRQLVHRYLVEEHAATAIEYGLIVALISVAIIGVLTTLGVNLMGKLQDVVDAFIDAGS